MSILSFNNLEDKDEYLDLFTDKLVTYHMLLKQTKDEIIGESYQMHSLPGAVLEILNDITRSISSDVEWEFKDLHPEYKNSEDELFIPRRSFKEDVEEALLAANQKFWNNANECPPCDTLQCADHLTDD
jgi:hypothetical protein